MNVNFSFHTKASVTLLEQLPIFIEKSGSYVLHEDILPMLYLALESSMSQVGGPQSCNEDSSKILGERIYFLVGNLYQLFTTLCLNPVSSRSQTNQLYNAM